MSLNVNFADYLTPLFIARRSTDHIYSVHRYVGVGFFLRGDSLIATCKHIVQSCAADEIVLTKSLATGAVELLHDIKMHPTCDFAIGEVLSPAPHSYFPLLNTEVVLGIEVQALGFTNRERIGKDVHVDSRLFKGYVSRYSSRPSTADSRSTLELSFPSLKGFSGAPVICANNELMGMLFSNHESTIELFKYSEVQEGRTTFSEAIHRVLESGLAHSAKDIRVFLDELGVSIQEPPP